jgi:hypothetical protein
VPIFLGFCKEVSLKILGWGAQKLRNVGDVGLRRWKSRWRTTSVEVAQMEGR